MHQKRQLAAVEQSRVSRIGVSREHSIKWTLLLLAPGQLISWGTLYYAIAFLAAPIERNTGWPQQEIFLAFSAGLLVAAIAAAPVGRVLARYSGGAVLAVGSLIAALSLAVIALSPNMVVFTAGWLLAGVAMALTQYEAAFAALRSIMARNFRQAIALLTVVGGLASTVFWPLTYWLCDALGWRYAMLVFAALHLVPCLLLHLALPPVNGKVALMSRNKALPDPGRELAVSLLLALAFAATAVVTAIISTQAGKLMEAMDISQGFALLILGLVGPMQVVGRLFDLGWGNNISATKAGFIAMCALGVGIVLLIVARYQPWALLGFAAAYGAANGVLTLVRGSIPIELLPGREYATSLGFISAPSLFVRAIAPAGAAWVIALWNIELVPIVLILVTVFGLVAFNAAIRVARVHQCC